MKAELLVGVADNPTNEISVSQESAGGNLWLDCLS